jgi:outer membrane immunogenic protein
MRHRLVCGAFALLASGGVAHTADLGRPYPPPVAAPALHASWAGFYAGINVGYAWADVSATARLGGLTGPFADSMNGIIGGAQVGYNWQVGSFVFGIETDLQAADQAHTKTGTLFGIGFTETNEIGYFGTVRGRLGFSMGRWLPYVTGGFGYGDFAYVNVNPLSTLTASHHTAWVVGGGVEAALAGPWSAKLEYLYLDTGDFTDRFTTVAGVITATSRTKDHILRVGLNYRFWPAAAQGF